MRATAGSGRDLRVPASRDLPWPGTFWNKLEQQTPTAPLPPEASQVASLDGCYLPSAQCSCPDVDVIDVRDGVIDTSLGPRLRSPANAWSGDVVCPEGENGVIFYDHHGRLPYALPNGRRQVTPPTPIAIKSRQRHRGGGLQPQGAYHMYNLQPIHNHNGVHRRVARAHGLPTRATLTPLTSAARVHGTIEPGRSTNTTNWNQLARHACPERGGFPTRPFIRRSDSCVPLTQQEMKTESVGTPLMYQDRSRRDPGGRFRIKTRQTTGLGMRAGGLNTVSTPERYRYLQHGAATQTL